MEHWDRGAHTVSQKKKRFHIFVQSVGRPRELKLIYSVLGNPVGWLLPRDHIYGVPLLSTMARSSTLLHRRRLRARSLVNNYNILYLAPGSFARPIRNNLFHSIRRRLPDPTRTAKHYTGARSQSCKRHARLFCSLGCQIFVLILLPAHL